MSSAHRIERVATLAHADAFDPEGYAAELLAEVPAAGQPLESLAELAAVDEHLAGALRQVDELAARVARIRIDHALAADSSIGVPTRKVLATTVVGYARDLGLLARRAHEAAARGGAADPHAVAAAVVGAAQASLAQRAAARDRVLAVIRSVAAGSIAEADRRARDRALEDATRLRWSAARRELEAVAAEPARVGAAPLAARLAAHPDQLDEPAPAARDRELTFADLIELD